VIPQVKATTAAPVATSARMRFFKSISPFCNDVARSIIARDRMETPFSAIGGIFMTSAGSRQSTGE
jgi:hypothetical protein